MNSFGMKDEIDVACELMLTEKDHRKNISKFIDDESLVDMLHNIDDKKSMWLAKNIQHNSFDTDLTVGGEFDANKVKGYLGTTDFKDKFVKIGHWLTAMNQGGNQKSLNDYSFADAYNASHEWHEEVSKSEYKVPVDGKWSPNENAKPLFEVGEFIWYDLNSVSCDVDSKQMGHCGTTNRADTILSLRLKSSLKPVVSMSVTKTSEGYGSYTQCKGKGNTVPPSETHDAILFMIDKFDMAHKPEYGFESEFSVVTVDKSEVMKRVNSNWVESEISSIKDMRPGFAKTNALLVFVEIGLINKSELQYLEEYVETLSKYDETTSNLAKAIRNNIPYIGDIELVDGDETMEAYHRGDFNAMTILGSFDCRECNDIRDFSMMPNVVAGSFDCSSCDNITSLVGGPHEVGGDYDANTCPSLVTLEGAPNTVGGLFDVGSCESLESLGGGPIKVGAYFNCKDCESLESLEGAPRQVMGDFYASGCDKLYYLNCGHTVIKGNFDIDDCPELESLEGMPTVGGYMTYTECTGLPNGETPPEGRVTGKVYEPEWPEYEDDDYDEDGEDYE